MEKKNAWEQYNGQQLTELEALAGRYKEFISSAKTERECAARIWEQAKYSRFCAAVPPGLAV